MGGNQVSVERLKELFTYHPDGYLINNTTRARCSKTGSRVGRGDYVKGYRQVTVDGYIYREHCLIWALCKGEWPEVIDHIDHNKHNNKIENLRSVTHKENIRHGSGRQAGLWFNAKSSKWHSAIYIDCVKKHLGCFDTEEEALKVRKQAEEEYW